MTFGALILANDGFAHKARIASVLPFGMLGAHVRCTDGTVYSIRNSIESGSTTIHTPRAYGSKSEITVVHSRVIMMELALPAGSVESE